MLLLFAAAFGWAHLLVSFLILLLIVCIIAAVAVWILSNIPGVPPWSRNLVWAIAGIVILIWLINNLGAITGAL
jgi:hypothetical protein